MVCQSPTGVIWAMAAEAANVRAIVVAERSMEISFCSYVGKGGRR
jgi:hypothetical protein